MKRDEAIGMLALADMSELSREERESLLLDWWTIDATDPDFGSLPEALKAKLANMDKPEDPMDSVYDRLVLVACRRSYAGVLSSYLETRLAAAGQLAVISEPTEELMRCPCCQYRTLHERGNYLVCTVCFWEDDGTNDLDRVSAPNHLTIREARANFERFGAVSESSAFHVLADGRDRYAR